MRGAVSVFGRSRRDYGHFHGRLLLRRPLPPSTAKNSLDRSARADFAFRAPARSHVHVSAGVSGYRNRPFMEDQPPPRRGVVKAKRLFSDAKGKGLEPRPCQSSRCSRPENHIAKPATPKHQQSQGTYAEPGRARKKAKSAQMSDLGCFWPSTGVAASAAAASHVNGHSQANYAQKHQRRSMPDMGGASEAKT